MREQHVHIATGVEGTHVATASAACVRVLHLWDLFRTRKRWAPARALNRTAAAPWWWPLRWLEQRAAGAASVPAGTLAAAGQA